MIGLNGTHHTYIHRVTGFNGTHHTYIQSVIDLNGTHHTFAKAPQKNVLMCQVKGMRGPIEGTLTVDPLVRTLNVKGQKIPH